MGGGTIWSQTIGPIVLRNNTHRFLLFFWEIYGGGGGGVGWGVGGGRGGG